jgi:predicted RNA binding protein YcfA (HicA-like mRNA interferase family)
MNKEPAKEDKYTQEELNWKRRFSGMLEDTGHELVRKNSNNYELVKKDIDPDDAVPISATFKLRDLEPILRDLGFKITEQKGSHVQWEDGLGHKATLVDHGRNTSYPQGTVKGILKQTGHADELGNPQSVKEAQQTATRIKKKRLKQMDAEQER